MSRASIAVGVAGWSIPGPHRERFPAGGSHLQRYASRLPAVEINSSFHRPHRRETYERWADSVPPDFRFAVKLFRGITHDLRLKGTDEALDAFFAQVGGLGDRFGCLLVQLPPSQPFERRVALPFIDALRERHRGEIAWEPLHASWFTPEANEALRDARIARVLADPVRHGATTPGGWDGLTYLRLHGSPQMYRSTYAPDLLRALAGRMALQARSGCAVWCTFDNTMGDAVGNALDLQQLLEASIAAPARR